MDTLLAVPIVAKNTTKAIDQIKLVEKNADIIEIRADFFENLVISDLEKIKNTSPKPMIFTCRPQYEGGSYSGPEDDRKQILKNAIRIGYEYLDVEYSSEIYQKIISESQDTEIILSSHNFEETPDYKQLEKLLKDMKSASSGIIKIVTKANSINDNFKIFRLLNNNPDQDIIAFCMGIYGEISRVLCKKYGSYLSFAALDRNSKSAEGQIQVSEMLETYNFKMINKETGVLGVAGQFAENSKSKYLHNPVFKKQNKNFVYLPLKVEPGEDLEIFVDNFRKFNFSGMAVTIPHKEKIIKHMDELDETAKQIGAVNTVVNNNGILRGYNTDYVGAVQALEQKTELENKNCLVIGAGGASRAVVYGLVRKSANVTIANRTRSKAENLAAEFGCNVVDYEKKKNQASKFDIIINTTSVGMYPDTENSVLKEFESDTVVMDIVYKPLKTKFIKYAEKAGCQTIAGEKMLVYQAMEQFELWTDQRPEFKQMHQAFFNIP